MNLKPPLLSLVAIVILVSVIFFLPMMQKGQIVGGDWSFPYTNVQLRHFFDDRKLIWNDTSIPTGSQIPHKNLFLFQVFSYPFGILGADGQTFQKAVMILIFLTMTIASYYLFYTVSKKPFASLIGSMVYVFSPLVFNYFNMGWEFVLLFLGLLPIISILGYGYLSGGGFWQVILVSILFVISFFQSQTIVWVPIVLCSLFLSLVSRENLFKLTKRMAILLTTSFLFLFINELPWIAPSYLYHYNETNISSTTSVNDLRRFSELPTPSNQLRGWGSLFNYQFEISFGRNKYVAILAFIPALLAIAGLIRSKKKQEWWVVFGSVLLIIPVLLFELRFIIGTLPFSNIIRDVGRFMVIGVFGLSLLITNFFSSLRSLKAKLVCAAMILSAIYPFLQGRLFLPKKILYGASEAGKDQRVRFLDIPDQENEKMMKQYENQKNLFFPTGGFVFSINDKRFQGTFAEIGDIDAQFSPFGSGVYVSDKSNSSISNFAKNFLNYAARDPKNFKRLSKVYGINNIFVRKGLMSNYNIDINSEVNLQDCKDTGLTSSDWSVSRICEVDGAYPLIYYDVKPEISSAEEFNKKLENGFFDTKPRATYECLQANTDCPIFRSSGGHKPQLNFSKVGLTKYQVKISADNEDLLVVLNQTYNPWWKIKSPLSGQELEFRHVIVNQLVNGWVVPHNQEEITLLIEYEPQSLYEKLMPISLAVFVLGIVSAVTLFLWSSKK